MVLEKPEVQAQRAKPNKIKPFVKVGSNLGSVSTGGFSSNLDLNQFVFSVILLF